jgi:hypothetical protein
LYIYLRAVDEINKKINKKNNGAELFLECQMKAEYDFLKMVLNLLSRRSNGRLFLQQIKHLLIRGEYFFLKIGHA